MTLLLRRRPAQLFNFRAQISARQRCRRAHSRTIIIAPAFPQRPFWRASKTRMTSSSNVSPVVPLLMMHTAQALCGLKLNVPVLNYGLPSTTSSTPNAPSTAAKSSRRHIQLDLTRGDVLDPRRTVKRIVGYGLPRTTPVSESNVSNRGDLLVTFDVTFPRRLTPDLKAVINAQMPDK